MAERLRLFILAGEPSGDRIGADLVKRLRSRTELVLTGVGGEELESLGLASMFPMRELAVMGWRDVLPRLPLLLWRSRQVAQAIIRGGHDVIVLIDAQEFSRVVARQVRAAGSRAPMLLYVAPAVWAWKPERAAAIKPLFNEVLSVLPFEPAVMSELGGPPTSYVGHPALERFAVRAEPPERGPLLLLPGSREGELRRHLPLMRDVAARLSAHSRIERLVIPTPGRLAPYVSRRVADWRIPIEVVSSEAEKLTAFAAAVAAVAVTGTVTLELALAGVPMVATYVAERSQARRWLKYRTKWASLPNAILDRSVVPEILDVEPRPERIASELMRLLDGDGSGQLESFAQLRSLMEKGTPEAPRIDPVERVLAQLARQRPAIAT
jgi:lipid-A-disaccharide synthase